jgi:hypothetical protein
MASAMNDDVPIELTIQLRLGVHITISTEGIVQVSGFKSKSAY